MHENISFYMLAGLMLLFILNDVAVFSNRFIGPIYRLRSDLASFQNGKPLRPIRFRENDHWKDLAESVNLLIRRIKELESGDGLDSTLSSYREADSGANDEKHC